MMPTLRFEPSEEWNSAEPSRVGLLLDASSSHADDFAPLGGARAGRERFYQLVQHSSRARRLVALLQPREGAVPTTLLVSLIPVVQRRSGWRSPAAVRRHCPVVRTKPTDRPVPEATVLRDATSSPVTTSLAAAARAFEPRRPGLAEHQALRRVASRYMLRHVRCSSIEAPWASRSKVRVTLNDARPRWLLVVSTMPAAIGSGARRWCRSRSHVRGFRILLRRKFEPDRKTIIVAGAPPSRAAIDYD